MVDIEGVGGAATAGLMAGAVEKPTGHAGEHHGTCTDCGAETVGRFCHQCGQPAHIHRSLLHLGEELLHGVMHFDGRVWRTLPMLFFRPGTLTRNWVHGKRTRYVSPLAMFLFTVFVTFMVYGLVPKGQESTVTLAQAQTIAANDLAKERRQLAEAEQGLAAAKTPEARTEALADVADEREDVADAQEDIEGLRRVAEMGVTGGDWESVKKALEARSGDNKGAQVNIGNEKLNANVEKALKNPEYALYKLQQTFYKFSFLLVPLSLPFVAALFLWKRGFTLYDHGVFILYSLTFVSMLILITIVAGAIGGAAWGALLATMVLPLVIPFHMYYQLKGAYGLRTFSALWRTAFLLVFCNIVLVLFFLAVLWLGFA